MFRLIFVVIFMLFGHSLRSQKISVDTLLADRISIRAVEISEGKVFYAGTHSTFGYVDVANPTDRKQIQLSEKELQFRTLAQNGRYFFTVNIESPAYFFKIDKKTLSYKVVFQDTVKTAFYDAFRFINPHLGLAFSDPSDDLRLRLVLTDGNKKWMKICPAGLPVLVDGEAAFAASNTNISSAGKYIWMATGGKKSRIFRTQRNLVKWQVFDTPFVQGTSSQGIYSIDFYDEKKGIAAGGDYTRQNENTDNIATTSDGGETWQVQASGVNAGYITCVKYRPGSRGEEVVAVGDRHVSFSRDGGRTWTKLSDERDLYTAGWLDAHTLVLAGKNRILRMKIE